MKLTTMALAAAFALCSTFAPAKTVRLYMCGPDASAIAALFAASQTEAIAMDNPVGAASALKVCYAA